MMAGHRPRDERTVILVPCRMNCDGVWTDACIHNVSARGLMASTDKPPLVGSYLDIRRGTLIIVGRVIWSKGRRFGVRTQDSISADAVVNEPVLKKPSAANHSSDDRRLQSRAEVERQVALRAEWSRRFASGFQFLCIAAFGVCLATFAAVQVFLTLAHPFEKVVRALRGG